MVIESWTDGDLEYTIYNHPAGDWPWALGCHGQIGGWCLPFKTSEQVENYMEHEGIQRPAQQLTLGI